MKKHISLIAILCGLKQLQMKKGEENEETKSRVDTQTKYVGCLQMQWLVGVENRTGGQFAWVRIMMLWI